MGAGKDIHFADTGMGPCGMMKNSTIVFTCGEKEFERIEGLPLYRSPRTQSRSRRKVNRVTHFFCFPLPHPLLSYDKNIRNPKIDYLGGCGV